MINKLIKIFLIFMLLQSFFLQLVNAQQKCKENGIVFIYFNGIMTTESEAKENLKFIKSEHKKTEFVVNEEIKYEYLYNTKKGFLNDLAEVVFQRVSEISKLKLLSIFSSLFFESKDDHLNWIDEVIKIYPDLQEPLDSLQAEIKQKTIEELKKLNKDNQLSKDYENHRIFLNNWINNEKKLLLFGHSQGNLFVNESYKYVRNFYTKKEVQVVHVAPASRELNGQHILANMDLVIITLETLDPTITIPRTTEIIPLPFFRKDAGLKDNILGHGLKEIYLNPHLDISKSVWEKVNFRLNNLACERCEADSWGIIDFKIIYLPNGILWKQPIYGTIKGIC